MADDISEDICDDWEDIVENGVLEKELERLKVKTCSKNSEHPTFHAGDMAVPRVLLEDPLRTQYTPTVKILKRPPDATKSGVTANGTGSEKSPNRQPVKTLQQREAEYAEARLRILGSARSEDDSQKERFVCIVRSWRTTYRWNLYTLHIQDDNIYMRFR
ncbi:SUZ domain-containing protein 1-like isoform X2 [Ornithodoros turicata]|uniref:SUZ domain-containing protein 1-like isoform X2 n=1 Tax=Ornithodoros turicata TaxID=34597 RepID=UPI003138BA8B